MPTLIRKFHLDKQTVVFLLAIGLLAVGGIWLLAYSTPFGLGLNDDSIAYIAGARSILAGQGYREAWLASNEPVTQFPPGFPAVLASIGFLTGLDPVRGARALNGLLFGLNIVFTGWLGWRMTGSRVAGLLSAALTLLSSSLLYIHTRAMSEPLYIFLTLLSFLLLDYYLERSRTYLLIALGFVLGWAYLARYAALSLLVTMLAALLVLHEDWRKRLTAIGILALSAFPWILAWSIRNRVVGGSFTNRVLGWHPITYQNWRKAKGTFADFLVPVHEWQKALDNIPNFFAILLISIGLALIIWVLVKGLPRLFKPATARRVNICTKTLVFPGKNVHERSSIYARSSKHAQHEVLPFVNGLYVIAYLLALFTTMTLFDPATKFQVRILSPTYISLILLLTAFGSWFWRQNKAIWKFVIVLSVLGLLSMFSFGQFKTVRELRQVGGTFAKEQWAASEAVAMVKEIPPDVLILTNEPGVVYLYTGYPGGVLPKNEPGISNIKQPVLDGDIVIVLFRVNKADAETLSYYYELSRGLYLTDLSSAWILSAFPE